MIANIPPLFLFCEVPRNPSRVLFSCLSRSQTGQYVVDQALHELHVRGCVIFYVKLFENAAVSKMPLEHRINSEDEKYAPKRHNNIYSNLRKCIFNLGGLNTSARTQPRAHRSQLLLGVILGRRISLQRLTW